MRYTYPNHRCWSEYITRTRNRHGIIKTVYGVGCTRPGCEWVELAVGMAQADKLMDLHEQWHRGTELPGAPIPKHVDPDAPPAF